MELFFMYPMFYAKSHIIFLYLHELEKLNEAQQGSTTLTDH